MKTITILALHLGYGGIEKYLASLCKMLDKDYKIKIISTYKTTEYPAFNFSDRVEIEYLINDKPRKEEMSEAFRFFQIKKGFNYLFRNIKMLKNKTKLNIEAIQQIDSDYIITTRDFHNKLVGKYAKEGIIKIASEHNHHNNNKKYINKVINSVKGFDYFILVSENLKKFYEEKINNVKCVWIPNVLDEINDKPLKNINHNLISIGRLSSEKGFDELIDVIGILRRDIKDIHLDLIGGGKLHKALQSKINNLNLNNNITMHGFKSKEMIDEIIKNDSLYVMTSHTESFGLVLVEAMSYGLPCIAFDSAEGAKDLIKQKELLITNRNKEEMANKIKELLDNKKEMLKIGEENYQNCQRYLLKNVKKDWIKLLEEE